MKTTARRLWLASLEHVLDVEEILAQGELGNCGKSYLIPPYNLSRGAQRYPCLSYLSGRQENLKLNV